MLARYIVLSFKRKAISNFLECLRSPFAYHLFIYYSMGANVWVFVVAHHVYDYAYMQLIWQPLQFYIQLLLSSSLSFSLHVWVKWMFSTSVKLCAGIFLLSFRIIFNAFSIFIVMNVFVHRNHKQKHKRLLPFRLLTIQWINLIEMRKKRDEDREKIGLSHKSTKILQRSTD